LSSDSFALGYTTVTGNTFDFPNNSYENSFLDTSTQYGDSVQNSSGFSPSSSIATAYAFGCVNQNASSPQNHIYSPNSSSNYKTNYDYNSTYTQARTNIDDPIFNAQRKSISDQLKQLDKQLLNKVSELNLVQQQINRTTSTLQNCSHSDCLGNKTLLVNEQSTIEIDKNQQSEKFSNACKNMTNYKEVFY
jgi:hypothetical protein